MRRTVARAASGHARGCWRVRLLLGSDGSASVACAPHADGSQKPWRVGFAPAAIDAASPLILHKTTNRRVYDRARQARPGLDDVLLWNDRGEVTESTIANIVIDVAGRLITPAERCGLLPGVLRAELLDRGEVAEGVLTTDDVARASRVWLINTLRGWIDVSVVGRS